MRGKFHDSGAARLPVTIDSGSGRKRQIDGLLDTGATMCLIPQHLAADMGLDQRGRATVGSMHRETEEPIYYARLTIPGLFEKTVAFVEMKPPYDFVVIGRTVLQHLTFVFDGIRGEFELTGPAAGESTAPAI